MATIVSLLVSFLLGFVGGVAVARKHAAQADAAVKAVEDVTKQ